MTTGSDGVVRKELYVSSAILAGKSAYILKASASTTSKVLSNPSTFSHVNGSPSCSSITDLPSLKVTTLYCFTDGSSYPGLVSLHVKLSDLTIFVSSPHLSFFPFWMHVMFPQTIYVFCGSYEFCHNPLYKSSQRVSLKANTRYCC